MYIMTFDETILLNIIFTGMKLNYLNTSTIYILYQSQLTKYNLSSKCIMFVLIFNILCNFIS